MLFRSATPDIEMYRAVRPALLTTKLVRELRLLERQTHRSGRDTVSHPKIEHDDHANAACGVLWLLQHRARMAAVQQYALHAGEVLGGPRDRAWLQLMG